MGFASLTEFKLGNGRRADVVGLNSVGTILIVEVKSTPEDFRGDAHTAAVLREAPRHPLHASRRKA